ncbi:MAG: SUMF1/EgtB/PvdO family nonheme iron enzyme [Prolixibacteraceae bacterium]|nr:SUMF1/EgtB/PvdO family nonheme iron enzyme [Prolixibacteraceae bacterium]
MLKRIVLYLRKKLLLVIFIGFIIGIVATIYSHKLIEATSTVESCKMCHVHPHVFDSWKLSVHYDTKVGIHIQCVDCHLPPKGQGYLKEKIKASARDAYGYFFKDSADFNWEAKSTLDQAQHHVFKTSCIHCHENLFPLTLTKKGQDAHLYYTQKEGELRCINCHLNVGHYDPNALHAQNVNFGSSSDEDKEVFSESTKVIEFTDFTEQIPNTTVSFKMKAIPGGSFKIGSPESEPMRKQDEGPVKQVNISPFFMAEVEVNWTEFLAFYSATATEGRSTDTEGSRRYTEVDAITGPTPPYGQPDQNWGLGKRPAITMSYNAAETYCRWLSEVTGKTYRLPTEAEWEYACRGGSDSPYFFEGSPKDFSQKGLFRKLFGKSNETIAKYIIFNENSNLKTQEPDLVEANPFGLKNMLGNAAEYCSDWYSADAYSDLKDGVTDPKGPVSGEEHVIRGGSFKSNLDDVRCAARDYTKTDAWLKTDPQMPKSIWWLSDCNFIGFRVVCEFDENTGK